MDPAADSRARPGTRNREPLPAMRALLAVFGVLTALAAVAGDLQHSAPRGRHAPAARSMA